MHRGFGPYGPAPGRGFYLEPHHYEHGGGPHPLAWAIFALLLALVVGLALAAIARLAAGGLPHRRRLAPAGTVPVGEPLAVLRSRYARGDISREEFLQASEDLGGRPGPLDEPPPP